MAKKLLWFTLGAGVGATVSLIAATLYAPTQTEMGFRTWALDLLKYNLKLR